MFGKGATQACGTRSDIVIFRPPPEACAGDYNRREEPTLTRKPRVIASTPAVDPTEPPLLARILSSLEDDKAEEIVTLDLKGRSSRHVAALAENLAKHMKEWGFSKARVEGLPQGDWVLIDAGDVIVHLFREEVRSYYDIESMWSVEEPAGRRTKAAHAGSAA